LRSANLPGYAGGFVQKLFGGAKPAPAAPVVDPRLAQIEASQRALQQSQGTYGSAPAAVTAAPVVSAAPVAGSGGGGMIGNALGVVGARNEALKAAAGYKDGRVPVHEGPGIVHGPGTTTSDSVNAKLSKDEAVLPATTVAALGGPDAVAELIERTNGKAPAMGLRGGQDIHAAWGWVDKAKQMAGDAATAVKNKFNGTPAAPNFAPEMPTGPIPEPTYAPSSAPSPTPPVDYDMPTVERKPLAIPKEYDLTADKGFPRSTNAPVGTNTAPNPTYTGAVPETAAVPPVKNVVPGVQSTAVTPKPNSSPSRPSEAASPMRPRPKRKSAPTQTWRAPKQSRSSFSAKSRSVDWESAASKPTSNTSSTPSSASALARCAALCRRKGGALG